MAKGMGNMQGMMQQMKKLQRDMEKEQQSLEESFFEATDHQNLVSVKVNGKKELVELTIQEALVDPEDVDMLQDLVIATVNEALSQVDAATQERMGRFTQGLNLPF